MDGPLLHFEIWITLKYIKKIMNNQYGIILSQFVGKYNFRIPFDIPEGVTLPSLLQLIVITGALQKIDLWPKVPAKVSTSTEGETIPEPM